MTFLLKNEQKNKSKREKEHRIYYRANKSHHQIKKKTEKKNIYICMYYIDAGEQRSSFYSVYPIKVSNSWGSVYPARAVRVDKARLRLGGQ